MGKHDLVSTLFAAPNGSIQELTYEPRVKLVLEPLSIAANITQGSHTRLDHVLLTLGNLYRIYTDPTLDHGIRAGILGSLEKRWKQADQEVFIVALLLNPYLRGQCFNPLALTERALYTIVERVFERLFSVPADLNFLKAFSDYFKNAASSEFSKESMSLDKMKALYDSTVRQFELICQFGDATYHALREMTLTWCSSGLYATLAKLQAVTA